MENMKISRFGQKEWLEMCAIFFKRWSRGNDEECKLFCSFISCEKIVTFFQIGK